jgi:ribosomal protein S18
MYVLEKDVLLLRSFVAPVDEIGPARLEGHHDVHRRAARNARRRVWKYSLLQRRVVTSRRVVCVSIDLELTHAP